ncbi:MAG: hypothetical protein RJQ09_17850 [Cyclobacteriaceae bacterium]
MFWKGCFQLIILFGIFFGTLYGIYLVITPETIERPDYQSIELIAEEQYYDHLNFNSSTLEEFVALKNSNYPPNQETTASVENKANDLSSIECLAFLSTYYLDKTLISKDNRPDALLGLSQKTVSLIIEKIKNDDLEKKYNDLLAFVIQDSWALTPKNEALNLLPTRFFKEGYFSDFHFAIVYKNAPPEAVSSSLVDLGMLLEDGSVSDYFFDKPPAWFTTTLESYESDTLNYQMQYHYLLNVSVNDNAQLGGIILAHITNKLESPASNWKQQHFNRLINSVDYETVSEFLLNTAYVSYEFGGLYETYNSDALALINEESRQTMAFTLDESWFSLFANQAREDLTSFADGVDKDGNSLSYYTELIETYPGEPDHYFERGKILLEDYEDFTAAITDFTEAILLDETYEDAYYHRSLAWEKLGEVNKSIADYDTVLIYNPENIYALSKRGVIKLEEANYIGAIQDFSETIKLDSTHSTAWYNRALAKSYYGDTTGALSDYAMAVQVDEEDFQAYINRALINLELNEIQLAVNDYSAALEVDESNIDALYGIGYTFFILDSLEKSANYYRTLSEYYPDESGAFYSLGVIYNRMEDYQVAYSFLTKTIFMDSTYADAFVERGYSSLNKGDTINACLDWVKAGVNNTSAKDYLDQFCSNNR